MRSADGSRLWKKVGWRLSACLLAAVLLTTAGARGETATMSVKSFAASNALTYANLSSGAVYACKLSGKGHEALIFADMSTITLDGAVVSMPTPARWSDGAMQFSFEDGQFLLGRFGAATPAVTKTPAASPTSTTMPALRLRPLSKRFKVVVDAGHGGHDPGAIGAGGLQEKAVNLDVAKRVAQVLREHGVSVTMTRSDDTFIELDDRVQITNNLGPDLFLCIHTNADESGSRGAMTLYPDDGIDDDGRTVLHRAKEAVAGHIINAKTQEAGGPVSRLSPKALGAGGSVTQAAMLAAAGAAFEDNHASSIELARRVQQALAPVTGCIPRQNGVLEAFTRLRVLRGVHCPAVLVEMDYISNRDSEAKLRTAAYRDEIAKAISSAVISWLQNLPSEKDKNESGS